MVIYGVNGMVKKVIRLSNAERVEIVRGMMNEVNEAMKVVTNKVDAFNKYYAKLIQDDKCKSSKK